VGEGFGISKQPLPSAAKIAQLLSGDTVSVVDDRFDDGEVRGISAGFLDGRMVD
jgi:hypothetical protein